MDTATNNLIAILMIFSVASTSQAAGLLEWHPDTLRLTAGIEHEFTQRNNGWHVFCDNGDTMVSNLGTGITIRRRTTVDIDLAYTHHSCVINGDRNGYNAVGIQINWYPFRD